MDHNLIFHPATETHMLQFIKRPSHAVLLTGPTGSGKASAARTLATEILQLEPDQLDKYPYILTVTSGDSTTISIDAIRELQHFVTLKIPASKSICRVIVIDQAQRMTVEAQNALLKILEEPPEDTVLILTADSSENLLQTILSRATTLTITPPTSQALREYFVDLGFSQTHIDKALLVSGGLPGLTQALLTAESSHPLFEATNLARELLQAKTYDRLLRVDALSKQKQLASDLCFILGQMARTALLRQSDHNGSTPKRWQSLLEAAYNAEVALRQNTQTKLVLTNLMLQLT